MLFISLYKWSYFGRGPRFPIPKIKVLEYPNYNDPLDDSVNSLDDSSYDSPDWYDPPVPSCAPYITAKEGISQTITSPSYPHWYPTSLGGKPCTTVIYAEAGKQVKLTFTDLRMQNPTGWSCDDNCIDYVEVSHYLTSTLFFRP